MILDYIKIPKIITKEKYSTDENYKYENDVFFEQNNAILFKKTDDKKYFWNVLDIAKKIKIKNALFLIFEKDENENIYVLLGQNVYTEDTNFAKIKISMDNFSVDLKKFNSMLNFLSMSLQNPQTIVYNINLSKNEMKKIMANKKFTYAKNFKQILFLVPTKEPMLKKILPFLAGAVIMVVFYFASNYFLNITNNQITKSFTQTKTEYTKKIKKQQQTIKSIKTDIQKYNVLLKNIKNIYRGDKDDK